MVAEIDPDELAALLGHGEVDEHGEPETNGAAEQTGSDTQASEADLRIVDIRDTRAFDRGHLPESESIPFPELTTRITELEGAERIVTVCPHGIASQQAAQLIGSYEGTTDARVESLRGGIEAWERDVGELVPTADADAADASGDEGPDAPF